MQFRITYQKCHILTASPGVNRKK
uniref:Uncharacterized protein n=1 Tax=Rhizophora mucronata TaxID=61149 RepID=A0A2P2PHA4_RHIMU